MKTFIIPLYGVIVEVNPDKSGSIISLLHSEDEDDELFNAAMDGIESLILAHAIAGIDVESSEYIEGIKTAVDACSSHL
jgi:hypothetical protein